MTDWTDANFSIVYDDIDTAATGPETGNYNFVWRAQQWPAENADYTWTYFLDNNTSIVGFIEDDPLRNEIGSDSGLDTRYYVTNGWPQNIPLDGLETELAPIGTVLTHDNVIGGEHPDWLFPGPGNDRIDGGEDPDVLVGGSGDDLIFGANGADTLYGDWNDAPIVLDQEFEGQPFEWQLPTEADTNVVDGNDQLNGGPRGQGWLDILTGGGGADAFYLNYNDGNSSSGGGTFWTAYGANYVAGIGGSAVQNGVDNMTTAASTEFFDSLAGSILLGGLDTAVGSAVGDGLALLLGMEKTNTPSSAEDVMVVTDFDPREDVLFMPVTSADQGDSGTTLTSTPIYFSESSTGENGQTGWGIEFTKGTSNTIYAEVFLAQDFLDAFGITESSEFAFDFIHDVFDTSLVIDENGVQNAQGVYPFPTDPSDYADGVVPVVADTPIPFTAPSGTTTKVFGAFGGLSLLAPTTTTTSVYVAGTNLSDILNVNTISFDPATVDTSLLTVDSSFVQAFGGDDIILAGNGQDDIQGGDGDDWIYGIGNGGDIETIETFEGNDGDDLIYLGWTSMSASVDGGDGNDTVSFIYVNGQVNADLSKTSTDPLEDPNATSTTNDANDNTISNYALMNVENLGGSDNDDSLTGDANDNVILGYEGSDILDGGGGTDTASYADNTGEVSVDLGSGTAQEFDSDGNQVSSDALTGFENIIGSPFDDELTGDGNDNVILGNLGNDTLDGGGGSNTLSYAVNTGSVTIDLTAGTASEFGQDGSSTATTVVSTDSFENFIDVVGSPYDDTLRNNAVGGAVIDGGGGTDVLSWSTVDHGVTVDLSTGTVVDNGYGKQDTLIDVEDVDGTQFDDTLTGDGNDNKFVPGDGMDQVAPGGGKDVVDLAQSATNAADYQSNTVTGTGSDWNGDKIETMGYTDFLIVQNHSSIAQFLFESGTETEVILNSNHSFKITNPVFEEIDLSQKLNDGNLVISDKGATLDASAVGAHFASPTPVTDGGDATADDDLLVGSTGDDRLSGRAGDDIVHGLDGSDVIAGNHGDDVLVSGAGALDWSYGGLGADMFYFGDELANGAQEVNLIGDYTPGQEDTLNLSDHDVNNFLETPGAVTLWAGADDDMIIVNGVSSIGQITFVDNDGQSVGDLWV